VRRSDALLQLSQREGSIFTVRQQLACDGKDLVGVDTARAALAAGFAVGAAVHEATDGL
jgi:hypothetical protein